MKDCEQNANGDSVTSDGLLFCPCCDSIAERERDNNVFNGQTYSDRYEEPVASQNNGFRVRCTNCGLQTCWWHHQAEADDAWNTRAI